MGLKKNKVPDLGGYESGTDLRNVWRGGECDQNTVHEDVNF